MRSLPRLVTAGLVLTGVAFGVNGSASADSGTAAYNGCENVATGVIRLLPSNLPAPYNTTCNTTTKKTPCSSRSRSPGTRRARPALPVPPVPPGRQAPRLPGHPRSGRAARRHRHPGHQGPVGPPGGTGPAGPAGRQAPTSPPRLWPPATPTAPTAALPSPLRTPRTRATAQPASRDLPVRRDPQVLKARQAGWRIGVQSPTPVLHQRHPPDHHPRRRDQHPRRSVGGGRGAGGNGYACGASGSYYLCEGSGGGGGGAGGYVRNFVAVTPGQTYDVVIGAAGTGGTDGATPGGTFRNDGTAGTRVAAPESCTARHGSSKPTPGREAAPGASVITAAAQASRRNRRCRPGRIRTRWRRGTTRSWVTDTNFPGARSGAGGTTDPGSIDPNAGSGGQDGYAVVIYNRPKNGT